MLPQATQPPHFDGQGNSEDRQSSSESSSDEEACDSDVGDPFEDVDEGGTYSFKVGSKRDAGNFRMVHRQVIRLRIIARNLRVDVQRVLTIAQAWSRLQPALSTRYCGVQVRTLLLQRQYAFKCWLFSLFLALRLSCSRVIGHAGDAEFGL
jgi:hypothetical protein